VLKAVKSLSDWDHGEFFKLDPFIGEHESNDTKEKLKTLLGREVETKKSDIQVEQEVKEDDEDSSSPE
jgi:hypothetical protein